MKSLFGKYISVLGASTSAFDGFNNSELYNTTITNNVPYYPRADVYACSMLHWNPIVYVDFYNNTKIFPETSSVYLHTDGVHPNKYGFEQMSDCFVEILKSKYA